VIFKITVSRRLCVTKVTVYGNTLRLAAITNVDTQSELPLVFNTFPAAAAGTRRRGKPHETAARNKPVLGFPDRLHAIVGATQSQVPPAFAMKPLVSILIPAFNAEKTLAYTIQSALAQTWPNKEIIIINDGSTDRTLEIAQRFTSKHLVVVSSRNQGCSAAINLGYRLAQGDYIQELDSDDLLARDKIERQLAALRPGDSKRILLSSPWAPFYYRTGNARFVPNSLWHDLSATEWLLRKFSENLYMQNATWLVSRELAEAAGPWDERLYYDNDGEYFARVLLASDGTRFVPETGIYYRATAPNSVSYIGNSNRKKDALFLSMKLQIQYLRSLEESERVRQACLTYLRNWYLNFYPERKDVIQEFHKIAADLQGTLDVPSLRWKWAWMRPVFGWKLAKWAQMALPLFKSNCIRQWDKAMFHVELRNRAFIPSAMEHD
jgi:glycosyltransferase involved in cell wall biosynthesis